MGAVGICPGVKPAARDERTFDFCCDCDCIMVMGGVEADMGLPARSVCRCANFAGIAGVVGVGGAFASDVMSRRTAEDLERNSFDTPRFHEPFFSPPWVIGLFSPRRTAGDVGEKTKGEPVLGVRRYDAGVLGRGGTFVWASDDPPYQA